MVGDMSTRVQHQDRRLGISLESDVVVLKKDPRAFSAFGSRGSPVEGDIPATWMIEKKTNTYFWGVLEKSAYFLAKIVMSVQCRTRKIAVFLTGQPMVLL